MSLRFLENRQDNYKGKGKVFPKLN